MCWAGRFTAAPRPPIEGYQNHVGGGVSVGRAGKNDADFWGLAIDYGRVLNDKWSISVGLSWDEQTEMRATMPDKVVQTYTLITSASYSINNRLGLGFGFGHGLWDDDNPQREFKSSDSLGAGVALSWAFYSRSRHSFSLTPTVEYDFDDDAWNVSVDLGYSIGF